MTDAPDLTPEQDAVRRLLADARHDGPTPPEVVARLDDTLASLVAERGEAPLAAGRSPHRPGARRRPRGPPSTDGRDRPARRCRGRGRRRGDRPGPAAACPVATPTPAPPQVATRPRPRAASSATAAAPGRQRRGGQRERGGRGPGVAEEPGPVARRPATPRCPPSPVTSTTSSSTSAAPTPPGAGMPGRARPSSPATCAGPAAAAACWPRWTARPGWWSSGARPATPRTWRSTSAATASPCVRSRCPPPDPAGSCVTPGTGRTLAYDRLSTSYDRRVPTTCHQE